MCSGCERGKKNLEESQVLLPFITECQDARAGEHCCGSEALVWRACLEQVGAGGKAVAEECKGCSSGPLCTAACMAGWTPGSPLQSCRAVRGLCWRGLVTEQTCLLLFLSNPVLSCPGCLKILWYRLVLYEVWMMLYMSTLCFSMAPVSCSSHKKDAVF